MSSLRCGVVVLGLLCLAAVPVVLQADPPAGPTGAAEAAVIPEIRDAKALADKIDRLIANHWREQGVTPAAPADDDEFLRRVYLDLMGRIPRGAEVLDFKDREIPFPREHWIHKELLESNDYAQHLATTWRYLIVPQDNNQFGPGFAGPIEQWLKQKFKENAHFDQVARELIASPLVQNQVATLFFQANQSKPENIAASTSRLLLGVKLECAQCHDHPFARWSRKQFWEYAAFFSGVKEEGVENPEEKVIMIPGTERKVKARFLDGAAPKFKPGATARETLAEWMLRSENPYFARAIVNRYWFHFFGVGLVDPVDDLSDQNPASHPELLDLLAKEFAAHEFDVKFLIRAITFTKAYQLSSTLSHPSQRDKPRLFARMNLKGLSGEQLYDSLMVAMDLPIQQQPQGQRFEMQLSPRADFIQRFGGRERPLEHQTSILQALVLMNGKLISDATDLEKCRTLAKLTSEPLDTAQRVEALYLIALGRKPRPDESARLVKYVDAGGPTKEPKTALGDVFWALLNSAEFSLNH